MKKYLIRLIVVGVLVGIYFPANYFLNNKIEESKKPVKFVFDFKIPEAVMDKYTILEFDPKQVEVVRICGTFNGWDAGNTNFNMTRTGEHTWEISLNLMPGRYAFKYMVFFKDEVGAVWTEEDDYPEYENDGYDGRNCVISITDYSNIKKIFELTLTWLIGGIVAFSLLELVIRRLMRAKISLQLKIALILTMIGLMVNLYILYFNIVQQNELVRRLLEQEGRTILVAMENAGVDFSKMSDPAEKAKIDSVIETFMGGTVLFNFTDSDKYKTLIQSIAVCDTNGNLIADIYTDNWMGQHVWEHTNLNNFFIVESNGIKFMHDTFTSNGLDFSSVSFFSQDPNSANQNSLMDFQRKNWLFNYVYFNFPIIRYTHFYGYLFIGISPESIVVLLNEMLSYSLILILIISVLYFILLSNMGKVILEPMHELIKGMTFIKEGHLDYQVKLNTRDEIAEMGDAYNFMSSELKKSHEEIMDFTKGLEKKVEQRTHELSDANEKLKEMDKLKTQFFANISHELRTPLTLMLGPVESMLQGNFGVLVSQMEEYLRSVYNNSLRLMKLINNLLDFSKLEAGRLTPKYEKIAVAELLRFYLTTLSSAIESKNLTLQTEFPKEELYLYLDKDMFEKVIMNLLSNAYKFTKKGSIRVALRKEDDIAVLEIQDTGVGIPADKIDTIFDRFTQVDGSSSREFEGTGIGLTLVKELVELQKGSIEVESEYGKGSLFRLRFLTGTSHIPPDQTPGEESANTDIRKHLAADFVEMKETIPEPEAVSAKIRQRTPVSLPDGTKPDIKESLVLITDDNSDMRKYIYFVLKDEFQLIFAKDGREGLEMAKKYLPDLVISDVMMPHMNGYEFCGALKSDPTIRHIPFVLLTAKADLSGKIEGLEFGADDYLSKPFNPNELIVRAKNILLNRVLQVELGLKQQEIEKDLQQAFLVQKSILTSPAAYHGFEGFEIETVFIPMNGKVSGDYYHIHQTSEGKLALMIADMSGHGVQAALSTMQIDALNRDSLHFKHTDERLERINYLFLHNLKSHTFCSAFLANLGKGQIEYSTAAHPAQILVRTAEKKIVELKAKGKLIGFSEDSDYEMLTHPVESGDFLFLFTDGIFEEFDKEGKEWGEEGLTGAVNSMLKRNGFDKMSPKEILDELIALMEKHREGVPINDNITIAVIKIK